MNYIIQITDGFDGETVKETVRTTRDLAMQWLKASMPDPKLLKPWYTYTRLRRGNRGPERTVIDYGSHKYFGRLYCNEEGGAE